MTATIATRPTPSTGRSGASHGSDGGAERTVVHGADNDRGDDGGCQSGQRHVAQEGAPGEVQVAENDEVGQIGAGQEQ